VKAALESLERIDWDFAAANTRTASHGIHPYPGKFIPQIPRLLIERLAPRKGSAILDPFCGSGTTLLEATLKGYPSIGIDSHPLACLIAKVKCTPLPSDATGTIETIVSSARDSHVRKQFAIPPVPRIDHWFKKDIQEVLASLTTAIDNVAHQDVRDALRVAFSALIVRVSNQESDTRYAAVDKAISPEDVLRLFSVKARSLFESLDCLSASLFGALPRPCLINKDILEVQPPDIKGEIALVVASPPYPNAYEYWLYHKYRMYWLGMNPIEVRSREIGARPHYFKKNHQTEHDFEEQMDRVFRLLAAVMIHGSYACFVIGRSIIHSRVIDNLALLTRSAERSGFVRCALFNRCIPRNRKSFNPANGSIDEESIGVFKLEGL